MTLSAIQLRKLADGTIQARRCDGKPLTEADRQEARRMVEAATATAAPPTIDQVIDDRTVAVLIDSKILGAPVWFAFKDGWRPDHDDGIPIFYASELPALRQKTTDQLRSIHKTKIAFGFGTRVRK